MPSSISPFYTILPKTANLCSGSAKQADIKGLNKDTISFTSSSYLTPMSYEKIEEIMPKIAEKIAPIIIFHKDKIGFEDLSYKLLEEINKFKKPGMDIDIFSMSDLVGRGLDKALGIDENVAAICINRNAGTHIKSNIFINPNEDPISLTASTVHELTHAFQAYTPEGTRDIRDGKINIKNMLIFSEILDGFLNELAESTEQQDALYNTTQFLQRIDLEKKKYPLGIISLLYPDKEKVKSIINSTLSKNGVSDRTTALQSLIRQCISEEQAYRQEIEITERLGKIYRQEEQFNKYLVPSRLRRRLCKDLVFLMREMVNS